MSFSLLSSEFCIILNLIAFTLAFVLIEFLIFEYKILYDVKFSISFKEGINIFFQNQKIFHKILLD